MQKRRIGVVEVSDYYFFFVVVVVFLLFFVFFFKQKTAYEIGQ